MKLFESLFRHEKRRYCDSVVPEELPGVKKKSFSLPFNGGEIWFEHLDGMYQYSDLVFEKLKNDSTVFLLPSKPSAIGFVLDETLITQKIVNEIADLLCGKSKTFMRVCFIGTNRKIKNALCSALYNRADFEISFINDFEKAKEWLIKK